MIKQYKMYINNEWVDSSSGEFFEVKSPINGEIIAEVPKASLEDADRAVLAAAAAKESYKLTPISERVGYCLKIADEIEKVKEELAKTISLEQGKPYKSEAMKEVEEAIEYFRLAAEDIRKIDGSVLFSNYPSKKIFTVYEPNGVYAIITPWNFPLEIPVELIAPSIAIGNTIVIKPASNTPTSVLLLGECISRVGLPKGVFNIITGSGSTVGEAIVSHPKTDAIGFVGEVVTGKRIASLAGLKRKLLEMGGSGPQIVLEDADIKAAAKDAADSSFLNSGQVCCGMERVLVHRSIKEAFIKELLTHTKKIKVGDPFLDDVNMGPLNNEATAIKIEKHIQEAVEKGAKIIYGGKRLKGLASNLYFEPTIIEDVKPGMLIHDEETFGPVVPIITFDTDEEAIDIANSTVYGLQMSLFTSSLKKTKYFTERLRTGTLAINDSTCYWETHAPFGGAPGTESGYGRIGGKYTLLDMMSLKTIFVDFEKCL